ncbi:hypothetical protein HDU84_000021 [Entophlyctis sp. JEL0112]|nr:hypothetical protein HDU84_000021 [Entophlyctis sp. JEL0112]
MGNPDPGESRDSSPDDELLVVIPLDSDDELEAAGIIPLPQSRFVPGSRRFFTEDWTCFDCYRWPLKVESLLTFRDSRMEKETSSPIDSNVSTSREIYVKFANASNRWNEWVPEDWLHQQTAIKLNNFNREKVDVWQKAKDSIRGLELQPSGMYALPPSLVVSKDSLTAEKILDVKLCGSKTAGLKSGADLRKIELENVQEAFVKWKGLGYDSATWEKIPSRDVKKTSGLSPDDVVRNEVDAAMYPSFVSAFAGWKRRNAVGIFERNRTTSKNDKFVPYEKQPSFIEGGILKDYQIKIEGLNWLRFKWTKDLPCILADEMGLGKTVQIVSFITALMREYNEFPFLILAPAITIGHWLDEFAKWSPNTVTVHFTGQKPDRTAIIEHEIFRPKGQHPRTRFHVLLTAYENMMLEASFFKDIQFAGLICDEGHRLKNDESKTFRNLMAYIKARHKVILSGTPLQNNIRELFNLLNFLDPEKYDDPKSLSLEFGMDNISQDDTIIPKIHEAEILVPVTLTHIQKKLYKAVLSKNFQLLRSIGVHGKDDKNSSSLKNVMMELRKICCHPYLANKGLEPENASPEELHKLLVESSGKLSLLQNMLRKLFNSDHRVLIFSQFKLALDIIEDFLVGEAYKFMRIDGDVPNHTRHSMINEFNANPKIFAFLLTTRTGGTGINLTAADTVIIYDCDWNPHQDIQAVARVHRIGQTRPVLIYRLFTRDTVEDSIIQRSTSKLALDKLVVGGMKDDEKYDAKELSSMLKFGAKRLFEEGDDPPSEQSRSAYDDAAVEKLLDRKGLIAEEIAKEDSKKAVDDSAQKSSFSFAKVWTLDSVTDVDAVDSASSAKLSEEGDDDFWDKLLQERLKQAIIAEEEETMNGLGKRRRQVVDYSERPKKKSVQQSDELEGEARFSDYEPDGDDPEDIEVSSGEDDTLDANPKMDSKMQPTHIVSSINASTSKPIFDEQYWVTHRFETVKNTLQSWIPWCDSETAMDPAITAPIKPNENGNERLKCWICISENCRFRHRCPQAMDLKFLERLLLGLKDVLSEPGEHSQNVLKSVELKTKIIDRLITHRKIQLKLEKASNTTAGSASETHPNRRTTAGSVLPPTPAGLSGVTSPAVRTVAPNSNPAISVASIQQMPVTAEKGGRIQALPLHQNVPPRLLIPSAQISSRQTALPPNISQLPEPTGSFGQSSQKGAGLPNGILNVDAAPRVSGTGDSARPLSQSASLHSTPLAQALTSVGKPQTPAERSYLETIRIHHYNQMQQQLRQQRQKQLLQQHQIQQHQHQHQQAQQSQQQQQIQQQQQQQLIVKQMGNVVQPLQNFSGSQGHEQKILYPHQHLQLQQMQQSQQVQQNRQLLQNPIIRPGVDTRLSSIPAAEPRVATRGSDQTLERAEIAPSNTVTNVSAQTNSVQGICWFCGLSGHIPEACESVKEDRIDISCLEYLDTFFRAGKVPSDRYKALRKFAVSALAAKNARARERAQRLAMQL